MWHGMPEVRRQAVRVSSLLIPYEFRMTEISSSSLETNPLGNWDISSAQGP
jgi:type IV secretory pathway component VirB8